MHCSTASLASPWPRTETQHFTPWPETLSPLPGPHSCNHVGKASQKRLESRPRTTHPATQTFATQRDNSKIYNIDRPAARAIMLFVHTFIRCIFFRIFIFLLVRVTIILFLQDQWNANDLSYCPFDSQMRKWCTRCKVRSTYTNSSRSEQGTTLSRTRGTLGSYWSVHL